MLVLIDNSNLYAGGGVQVAVSFLRDLLKRDTKEINFVVVQSYSLVGLVDEALYPGNFEFVQLSEQEQISIVGRNKAMLHMEQQYEPDVVFTTFGPSYYKSTCPKIVGFAIPHIVYPDSPYIKSMSFTSRIKNRVVSYLKFKAFKRNSDVLVFESEEARRRISARFEKKTYTVNNTLNEIFHDRSRWVPLEYSQRFSDYFNILSITANYPHKNLHIIPQVIDRLLEREIKGFRFILTLENHEVNFDTKYLKYITFLGKVKIEQVPYTYQVADILFMPTLLEVFSTSYLEAMFMEVPIVASDLPFARDVCADAAVYCEPTTPDSYASAIIKLIEEHDERNRLIDIGKDRIRIFGTSMDRTNRYLEIIGETVRKHENKR